MKRARRLVEKGKKGVEGWRKVIMEWRGRNGENGEEWKMEK